jgi:hypothetical protein
MGCIASATTVTIMIPMDTIKTRLVTQASIAATTSGAMVPYKGIVDCALRIAREEGISAFYRGLSPRLVSVVPMIGIQFGVYEYMKRFMLERSITARKPVIGKKPKEEEEEDTYGKLENLEEAAMEVASDDSQPFPAPHFHSKYKGLFLKKTPDEKRKKKRKNKAEPVAGKKGKK